MPLEGFTGELQNAADLVRKLDHDLERMRADPDNPYPAFDFYVTADSWIDWRWPDDEDARRVARVQEPMATASHLGNGAKHYRLRDKRHRSVDDLSITPGAFQPNAFQVDAFQVGGVVITRPDGDVDAIDLAQDVLEWIERHHPAAAGVA